MDKRHLTHSECELGAFALAKMLGDGRKVYGVPRGGVPVAYLIARHSVCTVISNPHEADVFVDDIIDSGKTRDRFHKNHPNVPFFALADFIEKPKQKGEWIVFPWEYTSEGVEESADDIPLRLLQYIGEDPKREGLQETPKRFLKAWKEWTSGYGQKPEDILKCFEDGSKNYDEMVLVRNLPFYSMCEHHCALFFGTASIAYIPDKRIVGLSKLGRLLEIFARRLQVQERMTVQIADALQNALKPKGVAVYVQARHSCMESRGLSRQGHQTITTALRGVFLKNPAARNEFLLMAKE